jgi:hypothetical protein
VDIKEHTSGSARREQYLATRAAYVVEMGSNAVTFSAKATRRVPHASGTSSTTLDI